MDASEFKEYIFGMHFLKRASDVFDERRASITQDQIARRRTDKEADRRAQEPAFYADTLFVPARARWDQVRHLREDIGNELNKAFGELDGL